MNPTVLCPACRNRLASRIKLLGDGVSEVEVWCQVGRCPSEAANNGATGKTEALAFSELERLVEEESNL